MPFTNPIRRLSQLVADQIIGAFIATAANGARWVISSNPSNKISGYSGDAHELSPGFLSIGSFFDGFYYVSQVTLAAANFFNVNSPVAKIVLENYSNGNNTILATADIFDVLATAGQYLFRITTNGVKLGSNASVAIAGINYGTVYPATANTGYTVAHGLGIVPKAVFVTQGAHASVGGMTPRENADPDATNVYLFMDGPAGATGAIRWLAIA